LFLFTEVPLFTCIYLFIVIYLKCYAFISLYFIYFVYIYSKCPDARNGRGVGHFAVASPTA